MKQPIFTGLCTALVTPFREGKVDLGLLEELIRWQIASGADAIVLCGTTGESPTLTKEEKRDIFRTGVRAAEGRCRIIAGTGSNCTASAVELSCMARQEGADGLLVVTPYYNKTTQTGLLRHYAAICDAAKLPVIAYTVPSRTGMDISVEVCRALAEMEYMAGLKDAAGNISKTARILAGCDLPVYSGNDDQTAAIMALGGRGVISVASNVAPVPMKRLTDAALAGDFETAAALQHRLLPLMDALFAQVNPIPVKEAMELLGWPVGKCRMPLDGCTEENRARLRKCIDELALPPYNGGDFK